MKLSSLFQRSLLAASLVAASLTQAQDIKLGYNGDLSASPSAQSGQAAVLGMQAAMDDINAAGGVLGRKLVLVSRDDLSQPPKSIQNMSELIDNEKVVAVFGPTNSGNAMAWKHIPNQKKIPVIGNVGSGTDITKPMLEAKRRVDELFKTPIAQLKAAEVKVKQALLTYQQAAVRRANEERIAALLQHLQQCRIARTTAKRMLTKLARH